MSWQQFWAEVIIYIYCESQKTVNTWKISGMLIVWWPIKIMFRTCEQTSKPQSNYRCCLRFSFLTPYWLFPRNTITFHKYFWCSRFCESHSKSAFLPIHERVYVKHGTYPEPTGTCRNLPEPAGTYPEPTGTCRNHPEPTRNPAETKIIKIK